MIDQAAFIHPGATVSDDIAVGPRTRIWQNATVIMGTILGARCNVGAGAVLSGPRFGNDCKISSGVVMGPGFLIGDRVFVGPCSVLANDVFPSVSVDGYDDEKLRSGEAFSVVIENDVMIGSHVTVLPGVRVGQGALLAAGAVVTHDVPPMTIWGRDGGLHRLPDNWRDRRMRYAKGAV